MRVSIAMAVRDGERYLPDLLESLDAQTARPHELVVYDDASNDSTPSLLAQFAERAPFPVRVERGEVHRGHVEGFLRAASRCTGDAVAFCDGDDVWSARKVEVCADQLKRADAVLVLHTAEVVDARLRSLGRAWPSIGATRTMAPLSLSGLDLDAPGMAMVFRRSLLEAGPAIAWPVSRYDPRRPMLHDEWTFFVAGVLGPIRLLSEPLVLYRQHDANDSGGWFERRRERTLEPANHHYAQAAAHTRECARFLAEAAEATPAHAERLTAGARHYARTATNWSERLSLYESPARRVRTRLLCRMLAARAYRRRATGGFGRAALVKDFFGGVVLRAGAR